MSKNEEGILKYLPLNPLLPIAEAYQNHLGDFFLRTRDGVVDNKVRVSLRKLYSVVTNVYPEDEYKRLRVALDHIGHNAYMCSMAWAGDDGSFIEYCTTIFFLTNRTISAVDAPRIMHNEKMLPMDQALKAFKGTNVYFEHLTDDMEPSRNDGVNSFLKRPSKIH